MNGESLSPENAATELAGVLEQQLSIYRDVLDLSRQQGACIGGAETEALMRLLSEKQKRIDAVGCLARQAVPLQSVVEGADLPTALRERLETLLIALREVLAQIVELEDAGKDELSKKKSGAAGKITHLQKGKMMHKAYGGMQKKVPPTARFKDKNG